MNDKVLLTAYIGAREVGRLAGCNVKLVGQGFDRDCIAWEFEANEKRHIAEFAAGDLLLSLDDFSAKHLSAAAGFLRV